MLAVITLTELYAMLDCNDESCRCGVRTVNLATHACSRVSEHKLKPKGLFIKKYWACNASCVLKLILWTEFIYNCLQYKYDLYLVCKINFLIFVLPKRLKRSRLWNTIYNILQKHPLECRVSGLSKQDRDHLSCRSYPLL